MADKPILTRDEMEKAWDKTAKDGLFKSGLFRELRIFFTISLGVLLVALILLALFAGAYFAARFFIGG